MEIKIQDREFLNCLIANGKSTKSTNRFTLIELLIVISVIGILATILIPSLEKARQKAKIAVEINNRKQLYIATAMYSENNNSLFPDRGNVVLLHQLRTSNSKDLNTNLIESYIGDVDKFRTELMFCDSSLFSVRAPNLFDGKYEREFCTLSFYSIPNTGVLLDTDFQNNSFIDSDPRNALWSCMLLRVPGSNKWLGHNAPVSSAAPSGASTVFVDGSAKHVKKNAWLIVWKGLSGMEAFRPIR